MGNSIAGLGKSNRGAKTWLAKRSAAWVFFLPIQNIAPSGKILVFNAAAGPQFAKRTLLDGVSNSWRLGSEFTRWLLA
jgi:hypothetical protein